jgi:membrane protein
MPHITAYFDFFGFGTPMIVYIVKILPVVIVWGLFTFMYLVMPNTKVRRVSGIIGGIIAGTLFVFVQWIFFLFQKQILVFNAIYGGFAVVPLFLIWLQISWLIVFFGAEISFAHQNVDMFEFDHDCLKASLYLKKILALRITHLILKRFVNSEKAISATNIGDQLGIPIRLVRQLLFELVEGEILSEVRLERENETVYQPALSPDKMTVHFVLDKWEKRGINSIPAMCGKETDGILQSISSFEHMLQKSSDNKLLQDI